MAVFVNYSLRNFNLIALRKAKIVLYTILASLSAAGLKWSVINLSLTNDVVRYEYY